MPRIANFYKRASIQNRLWTPKNITTVAWWDAGDLQTIVGTTDKVSSILDKSGNNYNLSQSTDANRPSYLANFSNGFGCLDFGNTQNSKGLQLTNTSISPNSVFFAGEVLGTSITSMGFITFNFSAVQDLMGVATGGNFLINTPHFLNNSTSSTIAARPTVENRFVVQNATALSTNRTQIYLGSERASSNSGLVGRLFECIILSSSNTQIRNLVTGYLAWKWGFTDRLPRTHPFVNRPPILGD